MLLWTNFVNFMPDFQQLTLEGRALRRYPLRIQALPRLGPLVRVEVLFQGTDVVYLPTWPDLNDPVGHRLDELVIVTRNKHVALEIA